MDRRTGSPIVELMTTTSPLRASSKLSLPAIDYGDASRPRASAPGHPGGPHQAPIAIGPYGPEVLDYELGAHDAAGLPVRRCRRGSALVVQGITSGPVWDRVCRCSSASTLPNTSGFADWSPGRSPRGRRIGCAWRASTSSTNSSIRSQDVGRCDFVADIANHYPIPIICALLGAPREDWQLFSGWAADISKAFGGNVAEDESAILRAWEALDGYLEDLIECRRQLLGRRPDLRPDPCRGRW